MTEILTLKTMLPQNLTTFSDSVSLMTRTVTPQTFFERFYAACEIAENIAAAYCAYEMYEDVDEWCEHREQLMAAKNDLIIDLANRLYETARIDTLHELCTKYAYELSPDVEKHIEYLLKDNHLQ